MPLFLAVDQSTSATKALVLDETGRILDRESREHTQHYPEPGFVEHDPEEIFRNTLDACQTLLERSGRRMEIVSLSISNQRETVVVFERATGKPVHRAIVWQCRRGVEVCEKLKDEGLNPELHQRTGLTLDPYFSASKVHWLLEHDRSLQDRLISGEVVVGTMDAYLIHRLTGGRIFATDHTNASRTLLYNISTNNWDDQLCRIWGIPRQALPDLRDSSGNYGSVQVGDLIRDLPIRGVMGDSHASLFAQRCFASGTTKLTLGTGSSILMNIGDKPVFSDEGVMTTLAWVHDGKPVYALEGIIVTAAASLTWLRSQLGILADAGEAEALAMELRGNDGVYLVPAFSGLGLPHWKPKARAVICGLSNHSDRRHLIRAALEAIAYQLKDALDIMSRTSQTTLQRVHADGGPTANKFLMQFIADLTGIPVQISAISDGSPLGAALMGMLGQGVHASLEAIAALPRQEPVYRPAMDAGTVEQCYSGWLAAVRKALVE